MEWFERWFGEEYKALYPHRDEAQAETQVRAVARAAGALPAWRILDIGCGAGRHLRAFRHLGFGAFGVDLSPVLIRDARLSGLNVARADMRALPFRDHAFHLVTCFFTSFGYFATPAEDAAALAEFRRLARPGGFLFLDLPNAAHVIRHLVPSEVLDLKGANGTDEAPRRVDVQRRLEGDSVVKRLRILSAMDSASTSSGECAFEERVRLYTPERIHEILKKLDFITVGVFGDEQGSPFDPENSPRMSLLLRCP
jgi:SAM-dependent methyltransferase